MNPTVRNDLDATEIGDHGTLAVSVPESEQTIELAALESWLFRKCDGKHSIADLCLEFSATTGTEIEPEALWATLDAFDDFGLLESRPAPKAAANFPLNRRGLLKSLTSLPAATVAVAAGSVALPAYAQNPTEQLTKTAEANAKAAEEQALKTAQEQAGKQDQQEQVQKAQEQFDKATGENQAKEQGGKEANSKTPPPTQIPAPSTLTLVGAGLGAFAVSRLLERRGQVEQESKSDQKTK